MKSVTTSEDKLLIRIGDNANENDTLWRGAKQNDLWFHLDGMSSPHVLLSVPGKKKTKAQLSEAIHECAQLVKYFSKAREMAQVTVMYIEAKWVSADPSGKAGSVILKKEPTRMKVVFDERCIAFFLAQMKK
ncbi:NFACT protein [Gracilaria domingensis]|nr:NFACT protein [Gracilaria domingensis]